jgi:shikimate kinase
MSGSSPRRIENLALVGFMGTGKSSVGRVVAQLLRYEFIDTDELLEKRASKTITRIFAEDGEPVFREMECALVSEMIGWRRRVIATGGGLVSDPNNLSSLRSHALLVCLWASPEVIWQRVRNQIHRPLLQDPDPLARIRTLLEQRAPSYRQADVLINSGIRSVREVAQQVAHQFHLACPRVPSNEESH